MEAFGSFLDHEECESLSKMFATENSDVMLHYNDSNFFSNYGEIPSALLATGENVVEVDENFFTFSADHNLDAKFYCLSQESSYSSEIESTLFPNEYHQANGSVNYVTDHHNNFVPIFPDDMMEEILQFKGEMCSEYQLRNEEKHPGDIGDSQLKRKANALQISEEKCEDDSPDQRLKKKSRVSRNGQNSKRKGAQLKKEKKASHDEEESYGGGNGQTSSSCNSEDDCKPSQEDNGGPINSESKGSASTCLNSNGKARASRGSATDPQSLYARRRRERINERLRILQNLVPNGTKVDISTMLEEAVGYVKFLQLQIKLLSSDDMWMYAPIAYNGMDIGVYEKMAPNLWPQN